VAVYEGVPVKAAALRAMFEQIVANNRAGGWRRLKREAEARLAAPLAERAPDGPAQGRDRSCRVAPVTSFQGGDTSRAWKPVKLVEC
jgi:hypothetical protein